MSWNKTLTANTKISSIWACMWLRSRVVLYRTKVQGMTISQERGTSRRDLVQSWIKEDWSLASRQLKLTSKGAVRWWKNVNRRQIPQKRKIKAWQTHGLQNNAEKGKLLLRNWKLNRLTDCQRKTKVRGVRSFLLIGTDNHSSESQEAVWQNQEIKLTVWDNFST